MAREVEPGVCLSGHLLSEEIGRGGFSRVFRAEPVGGGEAVAIKVAIRSELASALRAEGAVLRRLRSPRFVEIKEEHLEEDPPYFVLELCPGGDLRRVLDRAPGKRLAPADAEAKIQAILEGMAFAHDEGYVHGDLKPENVLLDARGEPKIADLGLSRAHRKELVLGKAGVADSLPSGEGDGKVRGTFDYLAPEVRAGNDLSPASDVFALGVLLYEMLVGHRPLGKFQLPRAALAKEHVWLPGYLDRVCARALAHDTRERYPDASFMLADLRSGEQGIELAAASESAHGPRVALPKTVPDAIYLPQLLGAMGLPFVLVMGIAALLRGKGGEPPDADLVVASLVVPLAAGFVLARVLGPWLRSRRRP